METSVADNLNVAKLVKKWEAYVMGLREGIRHLVTEESIELANLRVEMAERFIRDLEGLR